MKKLELSKLARSLVLPKGWKILRVYASEKGGKKVSESEDIYVGQPINEHLSISYAAEQKLIKPVLAQLNKGIRKGKKKWEEWGGGFGGGGFYEIHIAIEA